MNSKLFPRRNWLLRCSIFINIVVILLYICSHVMIGGGNNFSPNGAYIIQQQQQDTNSVKNDGGSSSNLDFVAAQKRDMAQLVASGSSGTNNDATAVLSSSKIDENISSSSQAGQQSQPQEIPLNNNGLGVEAQSNPDLTNDNNNNNNNNNEIGEPPVSFVNNSNSEGYMSNGEDRDYEDRLRSLMKCNDKEYVPETLQRGDFWVLKNYIRAEHGELKCHESITYTTHADFTFLDNLIPLLERWNAPVSIAIHAPGTDFLPTINSIKYLRDCLPENGSKLVKELTTFHIFFSSKHIPKVVPKYDDVLTTPYNCSLPIPYIVSPSQLYKTQKKLLYPVNVGRNIARDSALTNYILASDIELYPNPGLVKKFLDMVSRNEDYMQRKAPRVFPLSIFEVDANVTVPKDKTELQEMLKTKKAIPFHKRVCASCHNVPKSKEWMAANETDDLGVFHIGKRNGNYIHWEPIYIGTNSDPHYDERLSWEGKSDKMTQGYALCVLDYEFHILDNAFLVHKPGIKVLKKDTRRAMLTGKTNQLIKKIIYPELKIMYGTRKGCSV